MRHPPCLTAALWLCLATLTGMPASAAPGAATPLPDDLPRLLLQLADADPYRRGDAAIALGELGAPAVPALSLMLDSPDAERRWSAAIALGRMGAAALPALPALTARLADPHPQVRQVLATALGDLGPAARSAAPALTRLLSDRHPAVRRAATQALARVAPEDRAAQTTPQAVVATLDRLVPELLADHRVPGLAVALIRDGQLLWSKGYGVQQAGGSAPVTPDTVFEAASMSKPILAMLALQMVDAGTLALDRPVADYGAERQVPDLPEKRAITARMLLAHTAGYPNWRPGGEEREGPLPLLFQPGARFHYSGEGIFHLQRRMEHISGQPLARLAQQRLFQPLGLSRTDYGWTPLIGEHQATGHDERGQPLPKSNYQHPNAAYTLYTTANDYARLLVQMLQAASGSSPLLSRSAAQAMLTPQVDVGGRDPIERPGQAQGLSVHWGLGWSINRTAQGDIAHHSGANSTGFRSFAQFSPSRGTGLVILTNGVQGDEVWARMVGAVGDW